MAGKFSQYTKMAGKFASDNSPAILAGFAVTGVVSSVILGVKAGMQAERHLSKWDDGVLTVQDKALETWKFYIPAAAVGTATVAVILGSATISARRHAALISAYSLTEKAFSEYREKMVETLGKPKEEMARAELNQSRLDQNPTNEVYITGTGDVLCYDSLTGRYFQSSVEKIRKAENDINFQILNDSYASQNEFYALIGLPRVSQGDEVGWRFDTKLDLAFTTNLSDDGKPCVVLNYGVAPIRGYYKGY